MSIAISQTIHVLQRIVQTVPMGTNLALLQLTWAIVNGPFLQSRGAIFPALAANRLTAKERHRIWGAFRHGVWQSHELIKQWRSHVLAEGQWVSHRYEGYRPVAVDWTAIWRFKLQGWSEKLFNGLLGKAVRGVGFGLICDVGHVGGQRIPLLRRIIRTRVKDKSETKLKQDTLRWVRHHLDENEVVIIDAGIELGDLQQLNMPRYVIRLALNCTARRNYLPAYKGHRHPKKRLVAYGGSYRLKIFLKMPFLTPNFAKRHPLRLICPKVWPLIDGGRPQLNDPHQFITVSQPIF